MCGVEFSQIDRPQSAVHADALAFMHCFGTCCEQSSFQIYLDRLTTDDAGFTKSSGHDCGVAGYATSAGDHAHCCGNPVDVVGFGLRTHQNHILSGLSQFGSFGGIETDRP